MQSQKSGQRILHNLRLFLNCLATCAAIVSVLSSYGQSGLTITTNPQSQTVLIGGTATFSVSVSGTGPFAYQWQFNGTNLLSTNNLITTVSGTVLAAFGGDSGQATNACLNLPYSVASDGSGNLYVADSGNNRIRRITPNGIISTVAGN